MMLALNSVVYLILLADPLLKLRLSQSSSISLGCGLKVQKMVLRNGTLLRCEMQDTKWHTAIVWKRTETFLTLGIGFSTRNLFMVVFWRFSVWGWANEICVAKPDFDWYPSSIQDIGRRIAQWTPLLKAIFLQLRHLNGSQLFAVYVSCPYLQLSANLPQCLQFVDCQWNLGDPE